MLSFEEKLLRKIKQEKLIRREIEYSGKRTLEPNLIAISNALDEYFILEKLKVYCAYLSYSKIVNTPFSESKFAFIDEILSFCQETTFINPAINIFIDLQELYANIEEKTVDLSALYHRVSNSIFKNSAYFSKDERAGLYSYLSNFCLRKINEGDKKYTPHFFILNNEIVNFQYGAGMKKKTPLPSSLFVNMVTAAIRLKDDELFLTLSTEGLQGQPNGGFENGFDWVEEFIRKYSLRLDKKHRHLYSSYCLATLRFEQKRYSAAYKVLSNPLRVKGLFTNMQIRILHLKIIFEIYHLKPSILENDKITIEVVLESYRGLVRDESKRKQLQAYQLDFFVKFEKLYRKLYLFYNKYFGKLYNSSDHDFTESKQRLLDKINEVDYSYNEWLLMKVELIK